MQMQDNARTACLFCFVYSFLLCRWWICPPFFFFFIFCLLFSNIPSHRWPPSRLAPTHCSARLLLFWSSPPLLLLSSATSYRLTFLNQPLWFQWLCMSLFSQIPDSLLFHQLQVYQFTRLLARIKLSAPACSCTPHTTFSSDQTNLLIGIE